MDSLNRLDAVCELLEHTLYELQEECEMKGEYDFFETNVARHKALAMVDKMIKYAELIEEYSETIAHM